MSAATKSYEIEISVDTQDVNEFCNYLNSLGHDASIGQSTGNFIDGVNTGGDEDLNIIMNDLWSEFCNN